MASHASVVGALTGKTLCHNLERQVGADGVREAPTMGTPVSRAPRAMASPMAVPAPAISTGGSNAFRCPGMLWSTSVSFSVNNRDPPLYAGQPLLHPQPDG